LKEFPRHYGPVAQCDASTLAINDGDKRTAQEIEGTVNIRICFATRKISVLNNEVSVYN
jgi:hypothetical protein